MGRWDDEMMGRWDENGLIYAKKVLDRTLKGDVASMEFGEDSWNWSNSGAACSLCIILETTRMKGMGSRLRRREDFGA